MASKIKSDTFGDHLLTCSICYEHFKNPKVLPCLHSFCLNCVTRHYEVYKLCKGGKLTCPTCRAIIPVPPNGIPGFMNDGIVKRVKQILNALPGIDLASSSLSLVEDEEVAKAMEIESTDESDDETPSRRREYPRPEQLSQSNSTDEHGACAKALEMIQKKTESPIVLEKRAVLRKEQSSLQQIVANMRNKMLELYNIEDYLKVMVHKEIGKRSKNVESKKDLKKIRTTIEGKHNPTLALLAKEQDKLYKKLVDGKSVHDVVEEALETATAAQLLLMFPFLREQINKVEPLLHGERIPPNGDLLHGLAVPRDLVRLVRAELESSRHAAMNTLMPSARDPRKMGIRLLYKISGYGTEPGKFDFPTHATFMPNGDLLVSDKNNRRLQIFDSNGRFKKTMLDGIIKPRRARINPADDLLYVSDEECESVKIFSQDGELVGRAGDGFFMCAAGMDFDSKGNLVMSDPERNQISIHDNESRKVITSFLFRHLIDRKMPHPYYVTVNEDDQYIITDTRNNRVKVFSPTGRLLLHIDKLDCPRGICLDPYGNILVAEGDRHSVTMYSPYGKFLQYLVDRGEFGLCYPLSLDMDRQGRLAVTQCGYTSPHEILVFQLG